MFQARQGDVLIVSATGIPTTAKKQSHCILALGEATGHAHQIKATATPRREQRLKKKGPFTEHAFLWIDSDGTKYVEVFGSEAVVQHEEHGSIVLAGPAIYRIVQQREYTPEAIRNVAD